jgi:RNA polymerase sigma factor (sigma-70 family)
LAELAPPEFSLEEVARPDLNPEAPDNPLNTSDITPAEELSGERIQNMYRLLGESCIHQDGTLESHEAFYTVFSQYVNTIRKNAVRIVGFQNVEDVVNDLYIHMYGKRHHILNGERTALKGWFAATTRNFCVSLTRKNDYRRTVPTDFTDPELSLLNIPAPGLSVEDAVMVQSSFSKLLEEARQIKEDRLRALFLLNYMGLTVQECAELLGWHPTTVKTNALRARRHLKHNVPEANGW